MKKVIILCSALVFDFLTCSDASAYNAKFEAATIEEKLTTLISLVNGQGEKEAIVQRYANRIKEIANSKPQKWMGSSDLVIANDKVEFTEKVVKGTVQVTQPHQGRGKGDAQRILDEIEREINQLKAQRQVERKQRESASIQGDLEQVQRGNEDHQTSKVRPPVKKLAKTAATVAGIAAGIQSIQNRQTDTKNGTDKNTSIDIKQDTNVDQYSALQRVDQRPQIEGRTSVSQRQRGDVDQYSALQRVDRRPQIEGGNRERLALPASESSNSEVNNSGNRDRRMNKGNSDRLSPVPRDGFGNNKVSQSSNTENIRRQIADEKIQAQKANTEGFLDAPDSNMYKYAEKEVDAFGNEHEIGESSNPQFIDPTGAVGNQNSDNNLNYLDANQGMGTVGSQNFIGGSGTRLSLPGGK